MFQGKSEPLYEGHPACMHLIQTILAVDEL
jgi:hypothetical protein